VRSLEQPRYNSGYDNHRRKLTQIRGLRSSALASGPSAPRPEKETISCRHTLSTGDGSKDDQNTGIYCFLVNGATTYSLFAAITFCTSF
jgi:hypothetical protein